MRLRPTRRGRSAGWPCFPSWPPKIECCVSLAAIPYVRAHPGETPPTWCPPLPPPRRRKRRETRRAARSALPVALSPRAEPPALSKGGQRDVRASPQAGRTKRRLGPWLSRRPQAAQRERRIGGRARRRVVIGTRAGEQHL